MVSITQLVDRQLNSKSCDNRNHCYVIGTCSGPVSYPTVFERVRQPRRRLWGVKYLDIRLKCIKHVASLKEKVSKSALLSLVFALRLWDLYSCRSCHKRLLEFHSKSKKH